MSESFPDGRQKAHVAADAVNDLINELQERCQAGETIKDRCAVGVIGYGARVHGLANGVISELANNPRRTQTVQKVLQGCEGLVTVTQQKPIWVEPAAENGTPMAEAFSLAADLIASQWLPEHADSFPPVVINVTDGAPSDQAAAHKEALRLRSLATSDGNVLVFSAHISTAGSSEILLPDSPHGLPDDTARFLFDVTSPVPDEMAREAAKAGFEPRPGSRGFVFNASADTLIRLITFGSSVV
ncbi:MAG TPA: hypothetical protein VGX50_17255 [Longimicrobium sp.]|nr:hypothetical protein [Longimicrobium sp.]